MSNKLHTESSLYLKQHAGNPVDWYPWGEEALNKAREENKLIIVSIGYSACHWCHVMERESFENDAIAETMNKLFVSIKVDREERPDIDQVYMIAVQLMTNSGGWPLNCICLPDGRPIYGGTYFRPHDWQNILLQIARMWEETPNVAIEYAEKLTDSIDRAERLPIIGVPEKYTGKDIMDVVAPWKHSFDKQDGGYKRAPKFPLPNNWLFFLRYGALSKDQETLDHVHFTLRKIAHGGIYDHVGGGFARYSVDGQWHVPHFEKMLYDNAQLISLYSEAYQQQPDPLYERTVTETIAWLEREMLDENGGFYSALDADSEGVEGKFYTFGYSEFDMLGEDADLFRQYYNLTESGNWEEEETNVLFVREDEREMVREAGFSVVEWERYLAEVKQKLRDYRSKRIPPGKDTKQIVTWNALLVKGLTDAYRVFGAEKYLDLARGVADFILKDCFEDEEYLLHQPADSNRKIQGFLDDYAFTIEGFVALYEATFDEKWLKHASGLTSLAVKLFYDDKDQVFYYTASNGEKLISRKSEIMDNVIPASSSTMTRQLAKLGVLLDKEEWSDVADQVFANVHPSIKNYGSAYSNWAILLLEKVYGVNEIGITGPDAIQWRTEIDRQYIPNKMVFGGNNTTLPLLDNKEDGTNKAYLCRDRTCSLPQESVTALIELIDRGHSGR